MNNGEVSHNTKHVYGLCPCLLVVAGSIHSRQLLYSLRELMELCFHLLIILAIIYIFDYLKILLSINYLNDGCMTESELPGIAYLVNLTAERHISSYGMH